LLFSAVPVNNGLAYLLHGGCCVSLAGTYGLVLSSDEEVFGGWKNLSKETDGDHVSNGGNHDNRPNSFLVYAPSRTCAVYAPREWCDKDADRKPMGIPGLAIKELGPYYQY
jgi:1,4-alpha-glucan branching enzyme